MRSIGSRSTLHKALLGSGFGALVASGFSVWATVIRLWAGPAAFAKPGGTSYPRTVLFYFIGCTVGGTVVGALAPLRRWLLGSMLLGILFMLPVYACFFLVSQTPREWLSSGNFGIMLIVSGLGGSAAGGLWWLDEKRGR